MKLIRFGEPGKEKPGVMIGDKYFDLSLYVKDYDEDFFEQDGITGLKKILQIMRSLKFLQIQD